MFAGQSNNNTFVYHVLSVCCGIISSIFEYICYKRNTKFKYKTNRDQEQVENIKEEVEVTIYVNQYDEIDEEYSVDLKAENEDGNPVIVQHENDTDDEYLTPYQPIVSDTNLHKYISTTKQPVSGSAEMENVARWSGYLYPYQPLVLVPNSERELKECRELEKVKSLDISN